MKARRISTREQPAGHGAHRKRRGQTQNLQCIPFVVVSGPALNATARDVEAASRGGALTAGFWPRCAPMPLLIERVLVTLFETLTKYNAAGKHNHGGRAMSLGISSACPYRITPRPACRT